MAAVSILAKLFLTQNAERSAGGLVNNTYAEGAESDMPKDEMLLWETRTSKGHHLVPARVDCHPSILAKFRHAHRILRVGKNHRRPAASIIWQVVVSPRSRI